MKTSRLLVPLLAAILTTSATIAQDEPSSQPTSETQVNVISTGSMPKAELRYQPEVGVKQTIEVSTDTVSEMNMNGQTMEQELPVIKMTMVVEVEKVDANGDIHFSSKITDASVESNDNTDPMMQSMMEDGLDGIVGIISESVISDRGSTKSLNYDLPEDANPMVEEQISQISQGMNQLPIFPDEAIGVGAKWSVSQDITNGGLTITQTITYELMSHNGNEIHLNVMIGQNADPQDFSPPGAGGMMVHVSSLDGEGDGSMVIRLNRIAADSSKLGLSMEMDIEAQGMEMKQAIDVEVETSAKDG